LNAGSANKANPCGTRITDEIHHLPQAVQYFLMTKQNHQPWLKYF